MWNNDMNKQTWQSLFPFQSPRSIWIHFHCGRSPFFSERHHQKSPPWAQETVGARGSMGVGVGQEQAKLGPLRAACWSHGSIKVSKHLSFQKHMQNLSQNDHLYIDFWRLDQQVGHERTGRWDMEVWRGCSAGKFWQQQVFVARKGWSDLFVPLHPVFRYYH